MIWDKWFKRKAPKPVRLEITVSDKPQALLFSQRRSVGCAAIRWCESAGVPANPTNLMAALDSMGLLDREACKAVEDPKVTA